MTEPQSVNRLVVLQVILIVAIAILGAVGTVLVPSVVPDVPEAGGALALSLLAVGLLLYAFLGVRAINVFLTCRLSDLLVVLGLSFLATASSRRSSSTTCSSAGGSATASSFWASPSSGSRSQST